MKKYIVLFALLFWLPLNGAEFTRKSDSLELVKLFNSTTGNEWRHKSGWLTNQSVNSWFGVELDTILEGNNKLFVVRSINLSSNKLTGELPELNLSALVSLNLSGNQLAGAIPKITTPMLKILYLPGNNFTGELPDVNLPCLEVFDASGNELKGEIPEFAMPNLRLLNLNNNQLSGTIPDFHCPNLESIYFANNKLTGSIPNFSCNKLRIINLENNELSSSVPNFNLPNLANLNLKRNSLSGKIPIFNLPALEEINLSYNLLSSNVPAINCPLLKNLELQYNFLESNFDLQKCLKLESIRLNNNKITDLGNFQNHKKLNLATMNHNQITFEDIEKNLFIADFDYSEQDTILPVVITRIDNVFTLEVIANGIDNDYQWQLNGENIPNADDSTFSGTTVGNYKCIITNSSAKNLTLFTKIVNPMKVIYANKSDSLELVRFYNLMNGSQWKIKENWLTENLILHWHGIETDTIVKNGDSLLVVKSINLGNNKLKGNLVVLNLEHLENLDLYNNEFSGEIPNMNYPNLKTLDLSNNLFSGSIPNFNLPSLVSLDLSNNELIGKIPLLCLSNLEYFNVSGNMLSGAVPNFNFPKIDLMVLNENQLSGNIPNFNMPLLTFLEMNDNQLSGDLPGITTPLLRMVSVENNQISGLPDLKKYKSLEGFYIANNKLTFEDIETNVSVEFFDYLGQDTTLPVLAKYVDGNIELTVIANGVGNKYQWQNNKNDVYKANDKVLSVPFSDGDYRCKVTNLMATELTLFSENINPSLVTVKDYQVDDNIKLNVFPNPATDNIEIEFDAICSIPEIITIVNELGTETIIIKSNFKQSLGRITMDISFLPSGNYFVNIIIGKNIKSIPLKICR